MFIIFKQMCFNTAGDNINMKIPVIFAEYPDSPPSYWCEVSY